MAVPPTPPARPPNPSRPALGEPSGGRIAALLGLSAVYCLATSGFLLLTGLFMAATLLGAGAWTTLGAVLVPCALFAGAHWALLACLRLTGLPRPGATAALLTASVVIALVQAAFTLYAFGAGSLGAAPFAAALQGTAAATVLAVSRGRAVGWACAAVAAVVLLHALISLVAS